jgi:metal-sulfur cluster biosynthetic enzyme
MEVLRTVMDPEVPVLSIVDLGIVRGAEVTGDAVRVDITPTYSGCPAMRVIEEEVIAALQGAGYRDVSSARSFSPPGRPTGSPKRAGPGSENTGSPRQAAQRPLPWYRSDVGRGGSPAPSAARRTPR